MAHGLGISLALGKRMAWRATACMSIRVERFIGITAGLSAILCGSFDVQAQTSSKAPTFYVDRLQIGAAPGDGVAIWNPEIDGTRVYLQAAFGVAYQPLRTEHIVYQSSDAAMFQGSPLTHQFIAYPTVGVEIKNRVLLAVTWPMLLSQGGFPTVVVSTVYSEEVERQPSSVFDLRLEGRVRIFENDGKTVRLGLRGAAFLPIGDENNYTGETTSWAQLGLAAEAKTASISSTLNAGFSFRPNGHLSAFETGHEFNYGLGVYVPIGARVRLGGELFGSVGLTETTRNSEKNAPLEFSLNVRYMRGKQKLRGWVGLAGGARLTDGYAPDFRIVGLAGIAIPPNAEEIIADKPPADLDSDTYPDSVDRCPAEPEDWVHPGDGCPEPRIDRDKDRDGIKTPEDQCPDEPEDKDEIDDEDGCAEDDADQDSVLDPSDKCPKEPGVISGDAEKDGCPQFIERVAEIIEIRRQIEFGFDTANIASSSFPILREIALHLGKNKGLRLSIEGHTDDVGTDEYNDRLSQQRALAVLEHLVSLGVDRQRLSAKWFGKTKPRVTDTSEEAHAQNRRVEFRIEP